MALSLETCTLGESCLAVGATEKLLFDFRDRLRDWLKLQPHLPQDVPDQILEYLILGCKMSLERAKHKLDMIYTIKRHAPEICANMDPQSPKFNQVREMMQIVFLPKLTPEKYRILIIRPIAEDYSKFVAADSFKYISMLGEIRINEARDVGDVMIIDLAKASLGMLARYSPTLLKKFEVICTEAHTARPKGIHIINVGKTTDRFVGLVKSVLKPKLAARIHVHVSGNYESLLRFIPKSVLPMDYGGDEISMADLSERWRKKTHERRDLLLRVSEVVVDERLRPGPPVDGNNLFGFSGSFRKLDVD